MFDSVRLARVHAIISIDEPQDIILDTPHMHFHAYCTQPTRAMQCQLNDYNKSFFILVAGEEFSAHDIHTVDKQSCECYFEVKR